MRTNRDYHLLFSAELRRPMTIFGYNTDVKQAGVVYHVQSEARQNDLLLQTLVYVKGQCVGKQAYSYAAQSLQPDFSEDAIHALLKAQHKSTVDALEQGRMDSVLTFHGDISDIGGGGLVLNWINPRDSSPDGNVTMRFQVLDQGQPASGAEIVLFSRPGKQLARIRSDSSGRSELQVNITGLDEPSVVARASRQGKTATRKFRFRK